MQDRDTWWTHKQMKDKPAWFRRLISLCNSPPPEPTEETEALWARWCEYQQNRSVEETNREVMYPTIESSIYKYEKFFVNKPSYKEYSEDIDLKEQIKELNKELDGDSVRTLI